MRYGLVVLWMLFGSVTPATAQVSIGIGLTNASIQAIVTGMRMIR
jgi:hypothetical protein